MISSKLPDRPSGRLLGIDYGRRRLGIALSDPTQNIASPLVTYAARGSALDARYFQSLVTEHEAVGLVIGLPVHLSGEESPMAAEARQFGAWLAEITGLPVNFWDERYTSVQAEHYLKEAAATPQQRRARRDRLAAQILLQAYLDRGRRNREGTETLDDPLV